MIEFSLIPLPIVLPSVLYDFGQTSSNSLKLKYLGFRVLELDLIVFDQVRLPEFKQVFVGKLWDFLTDGNLTGYVPEDMTFVGFEWSDKNSFSELKILDNIGNPISVVIVKYDGLNLKVFCFLLECFLNLLQSRLGQT